MSCPLSRLSAWLRGPECGSGADVLMPVDGRKKTPLRRHKGGTWHWADYDRHRREEPEHWSYGVLVKSLVVVDVDDKALCTTLEQEFQELRACAACDTRQGRHYWFRRPDWADTEGFFDGARQVGGKGGTPAVDLKTVCSTGTAGLVVVPPSAGKRWVPGRAPWELAEGGFREASRALLERVAVAKPRESSAAALGGPGPSTGHLKDHAARVAAAASHPLSVLPSVQTPTVSTVERLLLLLNKTRWDHRGNWRDIATALRTTFRYDATEEAVAKGLWLRFSSASAQFEAAEAEALWSSVARADHKGPPVTLGTLHRWAQMDDPVGYLLYRASTQTPRVRELLHKGDRGLGQLGALAVMGTVKRTPDGTYYRFDAHKTAWLNCNKEKTCLWIPVSEAVEDELVKLELALVAQSRAAAAGRAAAAVASAAEPDYSSSASGSRGRSRGSCAPQEEEEEEEREIELVRRAIGYGRSAQGMRHIVDVASPLLEDASFEVLLDSVRHLLGVRNGVVDLRTGELRARQPEDMVYTVIPVAYDAAADTRDIEATVLAAMADDAVMARYLQELLGYGITGEVSEEIFVVFTGSGRNCKGVLTQLLSRVMDKYYREINAGVIVDRHVSNLDAERGKLLGSRLAVFNELQPGERLKTNEVQLLSGGDGIAARPLYRDPLTIDPRHLCILSTNHMPELSQVIPAIAERLLCVHFPVKFTDLEPGEPPSLHRRQADRELKGRLYSNLPRVLLWLVRGAVRWYANQAAGRGLRRTAPAKVKEFSRKYLEEQDRLSAFIRDRCEVGEEHRVSSSEFLHAYKDALREDDMPQVDAKQLVSAMRLKGYDKKVVKHHGTAMNAFVNLRLKPPTMMVRDDTSSPLERRFKAALEAHTGLCFTKVRPAWLRNPQSGHLLELDMYNEEHKLAVEYNGRQHYEFPNDFHKSQGVFEAQVARDLLKAAICARRGVRLVCIRACASVVEELEQFDAVSG